MIHPDTQLSILRGATYITYLYASDQHFAKLLTVQWRTFTIIQIMRQSPQIYHATNQWQLDRQMRTLEFVPVYAISPRFILIVRALRSERRLAGIDTGFGLSLSGRGFVDIKRNKGLEDVEEVPMEATQPE